MKRLVVVEAFFEYDTQKKGEQEDAEKDANRLERYAREHGANSTHMDDIVVDREPKS